LLFRAAAEAQRCGLDQQLSVSQWFSSLVADETVTVDSTRYSGLFSDIVLVLL
jgi:hypothetical protein